MQYMLTIQLYEGILGLLLWYKQLSQTDLEIY